MIGGMSDVLHDEWDKAYEEGRKAGRKEATLDCVEPSHDYGTAEVCLTCFEARVREDERARAVAVVRAVCAFRLDGRANDEQVCMTTVFMVVDEIVAAIDALRGSGNPDTPPSAEKGKKP